MLAPIQNTPEMPMPSSARPERQRVHGTQRSGLAQKRHTLTARLQRYVGPLGGRATPTHASRSLRGGPTVCYCECPDH